MVYNECNGIISADPLFRCNCNSHITDILCDDLEVLKSPNMCLLYFPSLIALLQVLAACKL